MTFKKSPYMTEFQMKGTTCERGLAPQVSVLALFMECLMALSDELSNEFYGLILCYIYTALKNVKIIE